MYLEVTKEVEQSETFKAMMKILEHFESITHTDWYGDEGVQITEWSSDNGNLVATQSVWADGTVGFDIEDRYSLK